MGRGQDEGEASTYVANDITGMTRPTSTQVWTFPKGKILLVRLEVFTILARAALRKACQASSLGRLPSRWPIGISLAQYEARWRPGPVAQVGCRNQRERNDAEAALAGPHSPHPPIPDQFEYSLSRLHVCGSADGYRGRRSSV